MTDIQLLKPTTLAKVSELETEWNALVGRLGWPQADTPDTALAEVKAFRKKWGAEYKATSEARLVITREYDAMKAAIIAEEKKLDEAAPDSPASKAKLWEVNLIETRAILERKKAQEAQVLIARAAAGPRFKEGVSKAINDYLYGLKIALDMRLNTDTDMDSLEMDLGRPIVLLPEKYKELANTVAVPMMQADPEVKDVILAANAGFKEELMNMFREQMSVFQRDLLTQIPARKAQIAAGIAGQASTAALQAEREATVAAIEAVAVQEANVATIEATIDNAVATTAVLIEYDPQTREDWVRLVAYALAGPESETGLTTEWFAKNMSKVVTYANRKLKAGETIAVKTKEVVKASRK